MTDYFLTLTLEIAEEHMDRPHMQQINRRYGGGTTRGMRISIDSHNPNSGEIYKDLTRDIVSKWIADLRYQEQERDRALAEPFWKKWLGA